MQDLPFREELTTRVKDLEEQSERNCQFYTDLLDYIPDLISVKAVSVGIIG